MFQIMEIIQWVIYFVSLYFVVFWFLVFVDNIKSTKKKVNPKKVPLKHFPFVTIAIPAYNEAHRGLEETIRSALALDYPKNKLEIIAINHGSTDNTLKIMNKFKKQITVINISREAHHKKGVAMNVALKAAKGEYFVSFDADSTIVPDALKVILPYFEQEHVAAVLPFMKVRNPKNLIQKMQWYEYLINMFYKWLMSELNCVQVAPGPFTVYKTNVLREIGGYDDFNLVEDFELTLRLQKYHYKVLQILDTHVYTLANKTLKSLHKQRKRWYKGTLINLKAYKSMLFNKEYGDFGVMQLPMVLGSVFISLMILTTTIIINIKPIFKFWKEMYITHFDIVTLINAWEWNFNILDLNYISIIIGVLMFVMTMIIFINANKFAKEKIFKHGLLSIFLFFLYYFFIMAIAWVTSIWSIIFDRNKINKW